jgi:hypothetical protein
MPGSANQVMYKDSSNILSGNASLTWDTVYLRSPSFVSQIAGVPNYGIYYYGGTSYYINFNGSYFYANADFRVGGDVYGNYFRGTALYALYADIAEKYLTDIDYTVGTLVKIGGSCEATMVVSNRDYVLGVISDKPAYVMNDGSEGQPIALLGRVPVKIIGAVKKGDPIWPSSNGCGCGIDNGREPFAFALEDGEDRLVECVIR